MEMLNRSAVIVKPRLPYLEWTRRDDDEGLAESVFETLRREPTVYLLPEFEDPSSQREVLEQFWPVLFEAMLEGWVKDEVSWPKKRTLEMFQEWFEVQMSAIVENFYVGEPLEYLERGRSRRVGHLNVGRPSFRMGRGRHTQYLVAI